MNRRRRLGNVPVPKATEAERKALLANLAFVAAHERLSPAEAAYASIMAMEDQDRAARIYAALVREQRRPV